MWREKEMESWAASLLKASHTSSPMAASECGLKRGLREWHWRDHRGGVPEFIAIAEPGTIIPL
jgi:hypothetical protein